MTALQWILKEAKKLKKEYPKRFTKWTDYVAQASAIYSSKHKGKSPVGKKKAAKKKAVKKTASKKVSGVKDSKEIKKTLAKKGLKMPHGYQTIKRKRKIGAVKKKSASKSSYHKDTASHNVKISVMSGIGKHTLDTIRDEMMLLNKYQSFYNHYCKMPVKDRPKLEIKKLKELIKETKTHIAQLKKHI